MPIRTALSPQPAIAVLALGLGGLYALSGGFIGLDSYEVLDGTAVIEDCVERGVWFECGRDVNEFALLQYLPALALKRLGLSYDGALGGLLALSAVSVLAALVVTRSTLVRMGAPISGTVSLCILLASPLLWYSNAAFGEAFAALVIVGATAALLLRAPAPVVFAAVVAAGISKETAPLFVAVIALAAWRIRPPERGARAPEVAGLVAGTAVAVALNAGFNVFRYGTVTNADYLRPELEVPAEEGLTSLAALLAAPTGGLVWMWPLGVALLIFMAVNALRTHRGTLVLLLWAGLLASLALWWSPFGGTHWGPRLLVPWLPALTLLGLAANRNVLEARFRRHASRRRAVAVAAAAVVLTGVPHMIATVDSTRYWRTYPGLLADRRELAVSPYGQDARCPVFPRIEDDRDYYWSCLRHNLWDKGVLVAAAYRELDQPLIAAYALLYAGTIALMAAGTGREASVYPPARA